MGPTTDKTPVSAPSVCVTAKDGYWVVVGGSKSGGIIVRLGPDMSSKKYAALLSVGAIVKTVEQQGTRLSYQRMSGSGPNYGWVSLKFKDTNLLEPYEGEV